MRPSPLVSIVVDNYNYSRYLPEAVGSALAQSHGNCEVVVVDDGSTDGSRDVIASFGGRIRAVLKANGGQASAFNAGFRASRGELVAFLDADDRLHPEAMERVVSSWHDGLSKVHFLLESIDQEGRPIGHYPVPGGLGQPEPALARGDAWPDLVRYGYYPTVPTSGNVYPRRVLEEVLPIPEPEYRICADSYLDVFAAGLGEIGAIDETLGCYRVHDGNAIRDADQARLSLASIAVAGRSLGHVRDAIVDGRIPGRTKDALEIQQLIAHFARVCGGSGGRSVTAAALEGLRLTGVVPVPPRVRLRFAGLFLGYLLFGRFPPSLRWWTTPSGARFVRWYKLRS